LVVISCGWLWWAKVRQDPNRVFWDMLSNNLSTSGVTHIVEQSGQGLSISQYTQMNFTQHPTAHALTVFKSKGSTLTTEEISNPMSDYVRYRQITMTGVSKKLNTGSVVGPWAQLQSGETAGNDQLTSGLFSQSLLDVLPIANLTATQRASLLHTMRSQNLFQYNVQDVKKQKVRGRETYLYAVSVRQDAYVRVMQQFEKMVGTTSYQAIKPSSLAKTKPVSVVIAVDARSHNLSQLYQVDSKRVQRYEGFGEGHDTPLPRATLTTQQLMQRLGALQQ
jgi:hypothetical protein